MKYLINKTIFFLFFLVNAVFGQNTNLSSNLKDFEGLWLFIPPDWSNDTSFFAFDYFKNSNSLTLFYRKNAKTVHTLGPDIVGFVPKNKDIQRLSDLAETGNRMLFYLPNTGDSNDSIKYFKEASPSCSVMYNGIADEGESSPPPKGKPNYFTFNFNGRENEYHQQIHHLPNKIVLALFNNTIEKNKIEEFISIKYGKVKTIKSIIHKSPDISTKMYLLKNDPVEIIEEKDNWLKIKYYPEKNGEWTGKTIEGWIKKSDVE